MDRLCVRGEFFQVSLHRGNARKRVMRMAIVNVGQLHVLNHATNSVRGLTGVTEAAYRWRDDGTHTNTSHTRVYDSTGADNA